MYAGSSVVFSIFIAVALVSTVVMATTAAVMRRRAASDAGPPSTRGVCTAHRQALLSVPLDGASTIARQALEQGGARVIGQPNTWLVRGARRWSLGTYGELVSVWLAPVDGGIWCTVESRPLVPWVLIDWGRNERNVDRVLQALVSFGATVPPGPLPRPGTW